MTRLLSDFDLTGMLEASAFECIDHVSPFLGALTNIMSGNECNLEITQRFASYVEHLRYVCLENTSQLCTRTDLKYLDEMIVNFRGLCKYSLGACRPSSMSPKGSYLLGHLVDAARHVGGIRFLHGSSYEGAYKILKKVHAKNSKPRRSTRDESVHR